MCYYDHYPEDSFNYDLEIPASSPGIAGNGLSGTLDGLARCWGREAHKQRQLRKHGLNFLFRKPRSKLPLVVEKWVASAK
jgi:hypothetical protein